MSTVQDPRKTWLATGSLLPVWWRMPSLGPRLPLTFWLWVPPTCLSASTGGYASSQPAHSPLVLLNPLFCEQARLCLAAAAAKSLQSCLTLCHPIDGSPPASPVPGTLQARTLEWVAISFSNAGKWKVKVKSLSCVRLLATPWTTAYQAPLSMGFSRQEYWSGVPLPSPGCALGKSFSRESSLSLSFCFSLAIPQFGLLSHVSSLRLSSGHSGLVVTLSMQPAPPCSAPACWCGWASGLLCYWELRFRRVFCVFFHHPPPLLCCPLRFKNSPQTHQWEGFLVFANFSSFMTPSLGRVSIPNSFVSLFVFYILFCLLLKRMNCSAFNWSFDEFVGEKVVSPSYSSAMLGPPLLLPSFFNFLILNISSECFCHRLPPFPFSLVFFFIE